MSSLPPNSSGLGSLAQPSKLGSLATAARGKHLNTARTILIIVGLLLIAESVISYFIVQNAIDKNVQAEIKQLGPGVRLDPKLVQDHKDKQLRAASLFLGGLIAVGVVFIVFGFIVKRFPVPITITSLVLYIALHAILAVLNPETLAYGWLIKIIFIVCLVKAIQAAIADRNEKMATAAAADIPTL